MSIAKVLIADAPIPWPGYGSWSQRMEYLLQHSPHNVFDYVICMDSKVELESKISKRYNAQVYRNRLMSKLSKWWRFRDVKKALVEINAGHDGMIICIMDSLRTKHAVWHFIQQMGAENKTRLAYYQCGFSTYLPSDKYNQLTEGVSNFIYLTQNAYRFELTHNPALPFAVNVLHNPIDHRSFYVPSSAEKQHYKKDLGMEDGVQFVWASQDRPKKGLDIVLQAWQRFYYPGLKATLHVVGANRPAKQAGVVFHGKQPNYEIHKYLKAADIGIFSPLWTEGFGLSLAEQMSCGLYCVASVAGGVSEYFKPGEHGYAVEHPHFVASWQTAFEKAMEEWEPFQQKVAARQFPIFKTYEEWCQKFCSIFNDMEAFHFQQIG